MARTKNKVLSPYQLSHGPNKKVDTHFYNEVKKRIKDGFNKV